MKRSFLIIFIVLLITSLPGNSQVWKITRYEGIVGLGTTNYMGDIGSITPDDNFLGVKDFKFAHSRPVFYFGARYKFYERISVKANLNLAWLGGNDKHGSYPDRGIVFSTFIIEPSLQGEIAIVKDKSSNNYLMMKSRGMNSFVSRWSFYGFFGLSPVFYWPNVIEPDPAGRTDKDIKHVSMAFPMGLGVKYGIKPKWKIAVEWGPRLTLTDDLDSFSPQSSRANDVYYFTQVNLIYVFRTNRNGLPEFW